MNEHMENQIQPDLKQLFEMVLTEDRFGQESEFARNKRSHEARKAK